MKRAMQQNMTSCIKRVGGIKICSYCGDKLIVHGKAASGNTSYKCKSCSKTQVEYYAYQAYYKNIDHQIVQLLKEGVGIRSTARLLKISATTVIKRILQIARSIKFPKIIKGKTYEVDEIRTFIKRN